MNCSDEYVEPRNRINEESFARLYNRIKISLMSLIIVVILTIINTHLLIGHSYV